MSYVGRISEGKGNDYKEFDTAAVVPAHVSAVHVERAEWAWRDLPDL